MPERLYWNTVTPLLKSTLTQLMHCELFDSFRLVGGTALSLQLGHRISVDIDLFTDELYDSVDFSQIFSFLEHTFPYVSDLATHAPVGMGKSYLIGEDQDHSIKLDLYYTEPFIEPPLILNPYRVATPSEITAMKMEVVQNRGRKKDFWDIHELLDSFSVQEMMALHASRYPYTHDAARIHANFADFSAADEDFDPTCLKGKYWELVKIDLADAARSYSL